MRKASILGTVLWLVCGYASAQNQFRAMVRGADGGRPLAGASISIAALKTTALTDTAGMVAIKDIPSGRYEISISFQGYGQEINVYQFPSKETSTIIHITLQTAASELAEVIVQTTRTNQQLRNSPTRIEALPQEELDEKSAMRPGDIRMLLGEATGIHVQQTSPVSGSANFRIQGLDSRYTQLLQDGMPLYQGFSGGLSLLQVSPLDLKQVEFIKGSASTLYGGGAIAGLINLISKTPGTSPELDLLLNGTSAKGADASVFYAQRWKHMGTTIFGSVNHNAPYDPSSIGLTAIPRTNRFSIHPKLFVYGDENNTGWIGINLTGEDRYGGDLQVINGHTDSLHQYFERNKVTRLSTQLSFTHNFHSNSRVTFKNAVGYFDRHFSMPASDFSGRQWSSFSEINYVRNGKLADWVGGVNLVIDHFTDKSPGNRLGSDVTTTGIFIQQTWKPQKWFALESGLRADHNQPAPGSPSNGWFMLPRINMLFKIDRHWSSRVGGGAGYKMPSLFNESAEQEGYAQLQPLNMAAVRAEQSIGGNADISYRASWGENNTVRINELFFYSKVRHPIELVNHTLVNAPGHISTRGAETNLRLSFDELIFYLGYTFTDTRQYNSGVESAAPLTPKHQLNADMTYEIEKKFRFGVEAFYTSPQLLSDGSTGMGFISFGLLLQKMWKRMDVFVNAENLTDRRQSRWESIYSGSLAAPVFRDIYAPLEGVVVNAGIKWRVFD